MKRFLPFALTAITLMLTSCNKSDEDEVISQRFIHKYGYDVSEEEWKDAEYPGQVITTLRDGVTVTASYEYGALHGPTTYTHPHSHTKESVEYYDKGTLVKRVNYSLRGIPTQEELYLSPTHLKITKWFKTGSPMLIEEYADGSLVSGEYMNPKNEILSRIENGNGIRFVRNDHEKITLKETYEGGSPILKETFYLSGTPHMVVPLRNGCINGEKRIFAETGEPVAIENFFANRLHGISTHFQTGFRIAEIPYNNGVKDGIERKYVEGDTLIEETRWSNGKKHGASVLYYDGLTKTTWYFNDRKVSKNRYAELAKRERDIAEMNERLNRRQYDQ